MKLKMKFMVSSLRSRPVLRALFASQIAVLAFALDGATSAVQAQVPPVAIPPEQQLGRPAETDRSRGQVFRQGLIEERGFTVFEREREGYEPLGARLADQWLLFAGVEGSYEYNTNVFTTANNAEKDSIFAVAPVLRLRSDMPLHQFNMDGGVIGKRFMDNGSEDTNSYFLNGNGRFDVSQTSFIFGRLGTARQYEDRSSPNAANGSEPTEYHRHEASVGFASTVLRLTYQADATWRRMDYNDVPSTGGPVDQDGRDIDYLIGSGRVGWEWQEGFVTYLRGSYNDRSHFSTQTTQRDSRGFDAGIGVILSRPEVFTLDLSAGYMRQTFKNAAFSDVTKPAFSANGAYNITRLTSLIGGVSRSLEETTTANASSLLQTVASVGVEHEILYNLLGRFTLSRTWSDFQGISREDDIWSASAEVKYLFNRNFYVAPRVQYSERESPAANSDYEQWRAVVVLGAQL